MLDSPWVIHECSEVGCFALKVSRVVNREPVVFVYEVAA